MGLLDTLTGLAGGNAASGLLPIIVKQLANYPGGIAGLIDTLQKGGLAEVVQSWVSGDANRSVTPSQLDAALPAQTVDAIATESGQPRNTVLDALAQFLPQIVDRATPNGDAGQAGGLDAGKLLSLLSGLGKH
ncbi:DUF937 domain-containing protein [Verticiella sediminum]|uniref:DUF937 domain-containing protein n=1 Tax=Verticiella sediminum TaxID=1247510 RepID=A0A556AGL4_9BURK|nr:YidB family protein [Verticiella sediminum]TSH92019.1 DUF937 domain-containing protein [Verticiella sediminum]